MALTLSAPKTYPVAVPAATEAEAQRKAAALAQLAAHLTVDNLELIGRAAAKPGANTKLKAYAAFL